VYITIYIRDDSEIGVITILNSLKVFENRVLRRIFGLREK
jgi:hypothetical protein